MSNLPWPILLHACVVGITGLRDVFSTPDQGILGITEVGISLSCNNSSTSRCWLIRNADLLTSYVPVEQNQFLYASAPARVGLGVLCGLKMLKHRFMGQPLEKASRDKLWFVML
jgi:hypothetical protein